MDPADASPAFVAGAADSQPSQDRRRKRVATVCLPCRSRKLKCDKELPACTRCRKSGNPEQCSYEDGNVQESRPTGSSAPGFRNGLVASHANPPDGPASRWSGASQNGDSPAANQRFLEERIQLLERLIMQNTPNNFATIMTPGHDKISARLPEPALITATLVSDFHEYRALTKELRNQTPLLGRLIRELNNLKSLKPAKVLSAGTVVDGPFLHKLLPVREVTEELVKLYLQHIEPLYRLIYLPAFRKQLAQFWSAGSEAPTEFVVQLLLMMASVWPLKYSDQALSSWRKDIIEKDPLASSHNTFNHLKAGYWVLCCEDWIRRTKLKCHDISAICLQAHLIIARDANRIRWKQESVATGNLVKMAISAGCHREHEQSAPRREHYQKRANSIHAQEFRRRIWATVVELDLKACMAKGIPPTVRETDFDADGPANIDDQELGEEIETRPQPRPFNQATDTALQASLFQSLNTRLKTCTLIYSPRFSATYSELARMDNDLKLALANIPCWDEAPEGVSPTEFIQMSRLWRGVLKYKIRHCLLSLHNRLTLLGPGNAPLPTSPQARVDVAADVLLHHVTTSECFRRLNVLAPLDCYGQAAITICHHLYTAGTGFASAVARQVVPEVSDALIGITEKLLPEFENKAVVSGKGHKEFLLIATILALTRTKMKPEDQVAYRQQLIEKIAVLGYRMLGHLNVEEATASLQKSLVDEPSETPLSVASRSPEHPRPEYSQWDASFAPTDENTPSDWSWDFMLGDWASTEFFSI